MPLRFWSSGATSVTSRWNTRQTMERPRQVKVTYPITGENLSWAPGVRPAGAHTTTSSPCRMNWPWSRVKEYSGTTSRPPDINLYSPLLSKILVHSERSEYTRGYCVLLYSFAVAVVVLRVVVGRVVVVGGIVVVEVVVVVDVLGTLIERAVVVVDVVGK